MILTTQNPEQLSARLRDLKQQRNILNQEIDDIERALRNNNAQIRWRLTGPHDTKVKY